MKYTLQEQIVKEYIINKSKFIVHIIPINNKKEVEKLLNDVRNQYKNATHYCYAYIINNDEKCTDDKEPSGTAGIPILNILKNNNLNNIICIVTRYFGGIKLGASGLIRAYAGVVNDTIKESNIIQIKNYIDITIEFDYTKASYVDYLLRDIDIIKHFSTSVKYDFKYEIEKVNKLENKLNSMNIKIVRK